MERLRERKGKFTFKLEFVLPLSTSQIVLLRHFVRNAEGKINPNPRTIKIYRRNESWFCFTL